MLDLTMFFRHCYLHFEHLEFATELTNKRVEISQTGHLQQSGRYLKLYFEQQASRRWSNCTLRYLQFDSDLSGTLPI